MTDHQNNLEQLIVETATALGMSEPENQILLEFFSQPTGNNVIPFPTSSSKTSSNPGDGLTRISGVFIHNDPKRFEPGALADAVTAYQSQIHSRQALGALRGSEFKASPIVDPATAAIVIESLKLDGKGNAIGVAAVCSKKLEALLRVGWVPAVLCRGLGRTNPATSKIRKGWRLTALDVGWTGTASNVTATSTGGTVVNESLNEQQQQPAPATPSADKPRLITVESLSEAVQRRTDNQTRMKQWIDSCRNNTKF
ncbi:hypothetical protein DD549_14385 [Shewanella algae]|uniref:hypothetical protein n=1 Tax=Shewanella algae TaxID=38313 RepID=UPI000D646CCB|nr:hypothetical protein [Shewanella algae]PWF91278.1 hypothetical protein DD549_14385 [Shewanella algae]